MLLHPLRAEWDADLRGGDPLSFPGYRPPEVESVLTGMAGVPDAGDAGRYALVQGRFEVLGGSMGAVHGERVVRAYRRAEEAGLPVVVVASTGGARLQEGMIGLVQMARTAGAARAHAGAGLLQVAVLRGPTTGGVLASYASLADVKAAEPGATIGLAGPRVVELVTGRRLPAHSHTAESAFRAGLVDAVVARHEQAAWVETALGHGPDPPDAGEECDAALFDPAGGRGPAPGAWGEVQRARGPGRLTGRGWARRLCSHWTPLQAGDPCIAAGLATVEGRRVVVVTMDRHHPGPAGYRLAQRAVGLAGRLGLPLLTLVDTPGADPGPESEAGGIAGEIARTLAAMAGLATPSVCLCVGEGGSGGALALAFSDRLLMLEHAVFSVIPPEAAAAILDRDPARARDRAEHLRLTADQLLALGVVDEVIQETGLAVHRAVTRSLDQARPGDRHRRFDAATAPWAR